MKILLMLLRRLQLYYARNKFVFILFVLCGAVNTIVVIYCYGNLLPTVANQNSEDHTYRDYYVRFDAVPANMEDVQKLAENPLVASCVYTNQDKVCAYDENYPMTMMNGTDTFTEPYQVIVPQSSQAMPGDKILLGQQFFQVIGTSTAGYYFIPGDTYTELGFGNPVTIISLYSSVRQDPAKDQVIRLIVELFPYCSSISGTAIMFPKLEANISSQYMVLIIVSAFIAVLANVFLLYHILDSLNSVNTVVYILGMSRMSVGVLMLVEALLLCMATYGLGIGAHWLLYQPIFRSININAELRYCFGDYCFVFLIMLILSLIVTVPMILIKMGKSPVDAKRRNT